MQDRVMVLDAVCIWGERRCEVVSQIQWNLLFQRINSESQCTKGKDVSYQLVASLGSSDNGC